ncbi:unnamed protein product [Rotaria sordida]|uniref:Ubiquinol-cytochrome c chaperone domain-containing protein n=1 Tax=Rotaria sordida TaxID=392033 RepID=A0A816AVD8_9BILA|nr:unnamed protein product [Rotaria sordida]CAF1601330.1 unnamed protein product [Rotaria sordida]
MIDISVDFDGIQYELDMPNVFASFERIVLLHIWFLLVLYVQLDSTDVFLRHQLARTMYIDLDLHAQQILSSQSKTHCNQPEELYSEMDTFIFVVDKNLIDDDTVLAAAIWKHFCHFQSTPLERLVTFVTYIRKNIRYVEQLLDENFMKNDYIYFLPLYDDSVNIKFAI